MFENLFVAKRKNNKRFEKEWLQNRLDASKILQRSSHTNH